MTLFTVLFRAGNMLGFKYWKDCFRKSGTDGKHLYMQGFEWTFGWNMGDEGGFPFIVDEWNVTTDGMIEIQPDIRAEPDWCAPHRYYTLFCNCQRAQICADHLRLSVQQHRQRI